MTPVLSRYAGAAAVATLWCTLTAAALLSGFPLLGERPLSWMVADPGAAWLFRLGLVAGGLLFIVFHGHVRARFRVDGWFSFAMLGGMACQLVAGVVPIDGSPAAHRVHTYAALLLGASLPVLMWRFAASQPPGRWRRFAYGLFWLEVLACGAGVVLSRQSVAPLAEILPALCFHLWVLVLTLSQAGRLAPPPPAPERRAVGPVPASRSTLKYSLLRHTPPLSPATMRPPSRVVGSTSGHS